jgi:hypothetical protein
VISETNALAADGVLPVHDHLLVTRRAERTFEAMAVCYPDAAIGTHDRVRTEADLVNGACDARPSAVPGRSAPIPAVSFRYRTAPER